MIDKLKAVNAPFWILTIVVFIGLLLPKMIQEGMFMDGMLYACVSKNLANGYGTFWLPKFSEMGIGGLRTFHEHPPLVFGIQAVFFKVLGNSFYIEKFYSFFTACITGWLIVRTWNLLQKDNLKYNQLGWLPVLYWIIMPIVYFSFQNNLMENTMGIFILLAFYFALRALKLQEHIWLNLILVGVFIFLASFSKGIPGLFPIGIVGLWWLIKRTINFKQMLIYTIVLIIIPALIYLFLILFNENAYDGLSNYTIKRLFHRIQNAHTVGSRFHILEKLIVEILPSIILTLIFLFSGSFKELKNKTFGKYRMDILFVFSIGLAGTIPLMLTLVQKSFYFIHALPFIALGLAMLSAPVIYKWIDKIKIESLAYKLFYGATIIGLILVITYTTKQIGKHERDFDMLHDVHIVGQVIPNGTIIGVDHNMHNDWSLHCYLVRYFDISFNSNPTYNYPFVLVRNLLPAPDSLKYNSIELPLKMYTLYEARE